jgi:hypothetical protein
MVHSRLYVSAAAIQQWEGQLAVMSASWVAIARLHNCSQQFGHELAVDAQGRDCAAAVRLSNLAAALRAAGGQPALTGVQLGGGRSVQQPAEWFEVEAAEVVMRETLGAGLCGTAHLHRHSCTHPSCATAAAAAADGDDEAGEEAAAAAGAALPPAPPPPPGLIIDGKALVRSRCSQPGCLREPHARRGAWCLAHAHLASGCRAAAGPDGGPCCQPLPEGAGQVRFCAQHSCLEKPSRANTKKGGWPPAAWRLCPGLEAGVLECCLRLLVAHVPCRL